jgi:hypothetical protein
VDGFGEIEKWRLGDGVLDLAETRRGIVFGESWQNDEELFSAVAPNEI